MKNSKNLRLGLVVDSDGSAGSAIFDESGNPRLTSSITKNGVHQALHDSERIRVITGIYRITRSVMPF